MQYIKTLHIFLLNIKDKTSIILLILCDLEIMMSKLDMPVLAFNTVDVGFRNQLIGAVNALNKFSKNKIVPEKCFLNPLGISNISDMKKSFCFSNFSSYRAFRNEVFLMLDAYIKNNNIIPKVFVCAYNTTESLTPDKNIDMICKVVKEYYKKNNLGKIFTAVLTSRLHNYQYVDLINVPKHMLTHRSRIRLLNNKKLRKRTLITIGIIHKFSLKLIKDKRNELENIIEKFNKHKVYKSQLNKIKKFIKSDKKVVICLGGRVDGNEIIFDTNYAKRLLDRCKSLIHNKYSIAIVNGPRTPNDVSDFLYEQTLEMDNILFHNCKYIATNASEEKSWRIYSGKNKEAFKNHIDIGNIYPGILGYDNTLAVHTTDSYSCCETPTIGIPTAISSDGIYIDKNIRIDCINIREQLTPKYVLNFEDFVQLATYMKIEPKHLNPTPLSNTLNVFVEAVANRLTNF